MITKAYSILTANTLLVALVLILASFPSPALTAAPSREKLTLQIHSDRMGNAGYFGGNFIADVLKKYVPWIQATNIEGGGHIGNIKRFVDKPELKTSGFFYSSSVAIRMAERGDKPMTAPYTDMRAMFCTGKSGVVWATLDKNIKSGSDLIGKKFSVSQQGYSFFGVQEDMLRAWEIYDKVQRQYIPTSKNNDALMDGMVKAAYQLLTANSTLSVTIPTPGFDELFAQSRPIYLIDQGKKELDKAQVKYGWPIDIFQVKPGVWGPGKPANEQPIWSYAFANGWFCDKTLPEDIVYEIVKILYEHLPEAAGYWPGGKLYEREGMNAIPIPLETWHPGAVKFLKEKGMSVGKK